MFGWLGSGTESRPFGPSVGRSDVESDGRSAGRMVGRSDGWLDSETVVRSDGRTVGRMIGWVAQSLISSSLPSPPTYRLGNGRRKNVPEICSWSQFPGLKNAPFPGRGNEAHGSGSVTILTKTARGGRCLGPASGSILQAAETSREVKKMLASGGEILQLLGIGCRCYPAARFRQAPGASRGI